MPNTNCLKGLRCPHCHSEGPFGINARADFKVEDDGTEYLGECDWDDDSYCFCHKCDHGNTVYEFTIKNQKPYTPCKCENCGWEGPIHPDDTVDGFARPLHLIPDLAERLDPGSTVPAGECPECQALIYPPEPEPEPEPGSIAERHMALLEEHRKQGFAVARLRGERNEWADLAHDAVRLLKEKKNHLPVGNYPDVEEMVESLKALEGKKEAPQDSETTNRLRSKVTTWRDIATEAVGVLEFVLERMVGGVCTHEEKQALIRDTKETIQTHLDQLRTDEEDGDLN